MVDDKELQRRLLLLKKEFDEGKLSFDKDVFDQIAPSILAVRIKSNGEIDLSTVDSTVRSLALMTEYMSDKKEAQEAIPLPDLMKAYFNLIEINFKSYYDEMLEFKASPHQYASFIRNQSESVKNISKGIDEFVRTIEDLWKLADEPTIDNVRDLQGIKAVFGGDLFPNGGNVASKTGIYVDTIVLPDPFIRANAFLRNGPLDQRVFFLIKYGLLILSYKDLALADVNPPIVVIVPDKNAYDKNDMDILNGISEKYVIDYMNQLYGENFSDIDEIEFFSSKLDSREKFIEKLKQPSLVVVDLKYPDNLEAQLDNLNPKIIEIFGIRDNFGEAIFRSIFGRMSQSNDLLMKSNRISGAPLMDAPTSWKYFQWRLGRESNPSLLPELETQHFVKALTGNDNKQISWLGNVPSELLITLRKEGALPELREILGRGVSEIINTSPTNFAATSAQVSENIDNAFKTHQTELEKLKSKVWTFGAWNLGACIVHGAIEFAGAAHGIPLLSVASLAISQTFDTPKIKDIPKAVKSLREDGKKLENSTVGLLFNIKEKS